MLLALTRNGGSNRLFQIAALALVYAITGWLGLHIPFSNGHVTLFWLPSGIALAAVYVGSWRLWPGILLGSLMVNLSVGVSPSASLIIACGSTIGILLTLNLLQRAQCNMRRLNRTDTFRFMLLTILGMSVPAVIGSLCLELINQVNDSSYPPLMLTWWMGDSLGILLAAPLLINFSWTEFRRVLRHPWELLLIFSMSLLIALVCFPFNNFTSDTHLPILFTSFVCVAWAGLRFGLPGSSFSALGFSLVALVSTINELGPFTLDDGWISYWMMWLYSASMTLLGLMITATHSELLTTSARLGESSQEQAQQKKRLEAIVQAIPDLLFEIDRQGCCLSLNGSASYQQFSAEKVLENNMRNVLPADAWNTWLMAIDEADDWGLSQGKSIHLILDGQSIWFELSVAKSAGERLQDDRFVCLARDITKRVQVHQTDLANEQRFRNIFETTRNIAVQGYNRYHEVIFWNKASEDLYGFTAQQAMGQKLEDLIIPAFMRDDVFNAIENWHIHNQQIPSGELPLKNSRGEEVWVYSNHVMIDTPNNKEMYCLDIDLRLQRQALQQLEQELAERKQIEEALRQSEQKLEHAQLMARLAYWEWDPQTDHYRFSRSMVELFSLEEKQLEGHLQDFLIHSMDKQDLQIFIHRLTEGLANNSPVSTEIHLELNNQSYWMSVQGSLNNNLDYPLMRGTLQDITERKRFDAALSAAAAAHSTSSADFFASILRALADALGAEHVAISLIDIANPQAATTHTYLKHGELQPSFHYLLKDTPCADVMAENLCYLTSGARELYRNDQFFQDNNIESYLGVGIRNAFGHPIGILIAMSEYPLPISPQVSSLLLIFAERISGELRRAEDQEQIYNLAFFDPLTHLPNRRMLLDRLKLIVGQSSRSGQLGALLFIDLDHFKLLNDTRGHHVGDQLLIQVAERISSIIRSTDLAARLGGDEFVVVFDNLGTDLEKAAMEAKARAEQLHELVNLPYPLQQSVYHCTISIGVNLFDARNTSIDDLLRHADVAMYQAKDGGRNTIRFFDPKMQSRLEKRAEIEADLRHAHESHTQLVPYYQAQVNHKGEVLGAELLLRWLHPTKGMISPGDFIPVAEQSGLIVAIGKNVIRMACQQLRHWQIHTNFNHLTLAVNVSPIQFNQSGFVEDVITIVHASGINPQKLKLELTESSLLKNVEYSIEKMQRLQDVGIGFSMDDFGIGYSSLSYLKKLPLDQLKIDQTFVRDIAIDPNDAIIVRTIIAMAENMNLNVIAEGVETELQKQFLEQNGCLMYQGFYFGKPMPVDAFEELITLPLQLTKNTCPPVADSQS